MTKKDKFTLYKVGYKYLDGKRHAMTYRASELWDIELGIKYLKGAKKFLTIQFIEDIEYKTTKRGKPYQILKLLDKSLTPSTFYDFNNMKVSKFKIYIFTVNLTKNEYSNKEFTIEEPQEVLKWQTKKE